MVEDPVTLRVGVSLTELLPLEVELSDREGVGVTVALSDRLLLSDVLALFDGDAPTLRLAVGVTLTDTDTVGDGDSLNFTAYGVMEPAGHSYPTAQGPEQASERRPAAEPYRPAGQGVHVVDPGRLYVPEGHSI